MGVYVEQEYRIKRAKGTGRDPKSLSYQEDIYIPVNRLLIIKVRHGADKKTYTWTPTKKSLLKSLVQGNSRRYQNGIDYITVIGEQGLLL